VFGLSPIQGKTRPLAFVSISPFERKRSVIGNRGLITKAAHFAKENYFSG